LPGKSRVPYDNEDIHMTPREVFENYFGVQAQLHSNYGLNCSVHNEKEIRRTTVTSGTHNSSQSVVAQSVQGLGKGAERLGCSVPGRGRDFSLRHRVQTDSGAHPASYPIRNKGVKLTTHLPLVPRLRIRGAVSPLPHTFSWRDAWRGTGTILTFTPV
jgi:hypothetical protein